MQKEHFFNRTTLFFYDDQTEKEFIKEYADRSANIVRAGLLLGSVVYLFVGLLMDNKFFPDNPYLLFPWRILGVSVMVTTTILIGIKSVRRYFQLIMIIGLSIVAIAIMKTAVAYHEGGSYNVSIAITGFIIFIYTLSRVRFLYTVLFTWLFLIIYLVLLYNMAITDIVITQTIVFIIVINIFGMSASYGIEFNIRDAFIKSKQLQINRKLLEAEHKRTSEELASVKELQLSMLPEKTPLLKSLNVAFHISTATEVGGDYCDYIKGKDGSLIFAIGDATGHGARASTMVMAVKMLFVEYAAKKNISEFMKYASTTIKNLKLPKLFMTLAIGRISENTLTISGAGIPSALLFKANKRIIERINLNGLPLGTFVIPDYDEKQIVLSPGDIIVFMTDGVTELCNQKGEMYESKFIEEQLKECSDLSAQEIVDYLVKQADNWRGQEPLRDDMTLLVINVKV